MNKHTATDRNGTVHTRNSAGRVYTHCVVARRSYENALKNASAKAWAYSGFDYWRAEADGCGKYQNQKAWETVEQHASRVAKEMKVAKEYLAGATNEAELKTIVIARQVAGVEANKANGYYDNLVCLGWNGSRSLAEKLASSNRAKGYYAEVMILEASMTQSKKKAPEGLPVLEKMLGKLFTA
jgi:hypothetical protein